MIRPANMNQNECKICGYLDSEFLFSAEGKRYAPGEYFQLYRCKKCGGVCIIPQLDFEAIQKYYPENYQPHVSNQAKYLCFKDLFMKHLRHYTYGCRVKPGANSIFKNLLSEIFDRLTYRSFPFQEGDGKLLDIGCGKGAYLSLVNELGWSGYGVESNFNAARYANNKLGLRVQTGDFEKVAYPEKHFDVITMWHSLEHFTDPKKTMGKVRKLLKDGGMLMIGLPNFSSLDRKLFKEYWNGLEIPLHAYHFSPSCIKYLLKESGFEVKRIIHTTRPIDMMKSFINFLEDRHRLKSNKFLMMILLLLSIPLALGFSIFRRSSIIKVFAG